jgi:hypothetical protein
MTMLPTKLYQRLAGLLQARENCEKSHNTEWYARHAERAETLVKEHMPSGGGFDSGTTLDFGDSTPEKLVFHTSYHHMTDGGYDGWTNHDVTVRPSLAFGCLVTIGGHNRNDIKDYIGDCFAEALSLEVTE